MKLYIAQVDLIQGIEPLLTLDKELHVNLECYREPSFLCLVFKACHDTMTDYISGHHAYIVTCNSLHTTSDFLPLCCTW